MRVLPPTLRGFVVLLAVSAQASPARKPRTGALSPPLHSPSVSAITDAAKISTKPSGATGGAIRGGSVHFKSMTWLRSIEAARICLVLLGCLAAGWAAGFAMGYRRAVNAGLMMDSHLQGRTSDQR